MSTLKCPSCGADTQYAAFSGGKEWDCTKCDDSGPYPDDGVIYCKAQLLTQGRDGYNQLREMMMQDLAKNLTEDDKEILNKVNEDPKEQIQDTSAETQDSDDIPAARVVGKRTDWDSWWSEFLRKHPNWWYLRS